MDSLQLMRRSDMMMVVGVRGISAVSPRNDHTSRCRTLRPNLDIGADVLHEEWSRDSF